MNDSHHVYRYWNDALADELFPEVDNALRSGQHICESDDSYHCYLTNAFEHLLRWYSRFNLKLNCSNEQVFYLTRNSMNKNHHVTTKRLSKLSMMSGMTLLTMMMDGLHVKEGWLAREQVIERLLNYVPETRMGELFGRSQTGTDLDHSKMLKSLDEALLQLKRLGMITLNEDYIRPHLSLYRFLEPVRSVEGEGQQRVHLQQLIKEGYLEALSQSEVPEQGAEISDNSEFSGDNPDKKEAPTDSEVLNLKGDQL